MAKRGYKLQEFVAHSSNVNCLCIGKKGCRLFITGGDDHKVNLWTIGQPTSLMSLCGHTSPIESVSFDTAEVLVLAGASSGAIKMWDLEEAKMVRTLTGHRSNCTAVEFHPFGQFFASGSSDTNLRIWDIRKKGCIHTYKGHTRGISTIKFTPDGRWVVSGGLDNAVKVWDLTAGKLLHDFKFHEGHIRSIAFHPLEFLLATGSADRTVKFWDLETFELIGSSRPEASGVCAMSFHPDGRTLFCGLEDSLKVYSWEPVVSHDSVEMGWSTLSDLCIHDDKLLGCSYYRNSVGVWVADLSLTEPYGVATVPEKSERMEQKFSIPRSPPGKVRNGVRSASSLRSRSPDYEIKEIKNIYVDCPCETPVAPQKVGSLSSPTVVLPFNSKDMGDTTPEKTCAIKEVESKSSGQAVNKSLVAPNIVPRESTLEKDSARETITFSKTKPGMLLRPAHIRRPSNGRNDMEKLSANLESGSVTSVTSKKGSATDLISQTGIVSEDATEKPSEEKISNIKSVSEKLEKVLLSETPTNLENCDGDINGSKEISAVKIVNGVAVVAGRTRSLVERFERRERFGNEDQPKDLNPSPVSETKVSPGTTVHISYQDDAGRTPSSATTVTPQVMPKTEKTPEVIAETEKTFEVIPEADKILQTVPETEKTPEVIPETEKTSEVIPEADKILQTVPETEKTPTMVTIALPPQVIKETVKERTPALATNRFSRVLPEKGRTSTIVSNRPPRAVPEMERTPITVHRNPSMRSGRERTFTKTTDITIVLPARDRTPPAAYTAPRTLCDTDRTPTPREEPQTSGRDTSCTSYVDVTEDLMETHDMFLSMLKSRLTKLQVIRHSWVRNDIKGAVDAMRRLPDHSVQADIVSVLMEKMEIITLDLFSCLLPVLLGLLDSKMERHLSISLEMLLKLVAVFGPRIHSTVSAPPSVGVDLHLEERRECCKKCYVELQKIQEILPVIIRKGGVLARSARELNLVLQQS